MRKMKESGVEWIGKIPISWQIKKLKYDFEVVSGATPKSTDERNWDGDICWVTPADYKTADKYIHGGNRNLSRTGYTNCNTTIVPIGSIIFSKRAPVGTVAIAAIPLCTNQGCLSCIKNAYTSEEYYFYLLSVLTKQFNLCATGTTFKELSQSNFLNFKLPAPPLSEQYAIAKYLSEKCNKIDACLKKIQSQISTLEDYRKSIITKAVTKGLNPDVSMKDSRVRWCPSIPSHWNVYNPKALFTMRDQRAKAGERQLTASQKYGIVYQDEFMEMESQRVVVVVKDFSILKHVEPGDFVISMRSFQGGLEYSTKRGCISSAYVMLIPNAKKVYPPFYRWFFKSSKYINALQSTTNLIRDGQAMRYKNFAMIPLFDIPLEEQKEIAHYLDEKCKKIDHLIVLKKEQFLALDAYKKSLIYAYVTGKKEVPSHE